MFQDLYDSLAEVATKYYRETHDEDNKSKIDTKKYALIVRQRIRRFLDNPITRPKMSVTEAYKYYVESDQALFNLTERYNEMNDLIDYINFEICPYIYDRIDILNIFQITDGTYGQIVDDCRENIIVVANNDEKETIGQLFLSIDKQLLADRNMAAETGQRNPKAIDNVNKYSKKDGGHDVVVKKESTAVASQTLVFSTESIEKALKGKYDYVNHTPTKKLK